MTHGPDAEVQFFVEIGRVLQGGDEATHFFRFQEPVPEAVLSDVTAWLRTLPSALGETEFAARVQARYGPPESPEDGAAPLSKRDDGEQFIPA